MSVLSLFISYKIRRDYLDLWIIKSDLVRLCFLFLIELNEMENLAASVSVENRVGWFCELS